MIVVQIDSGEVRNQLNDLGRLIDHPRAILQASARTVRRRLQRHFMERNRRPNRLGGRRTQFWSQIRTATNIGAVTNAQAEIVIADPRFAQKLYGGVIRAKEAGALTIPVHPEAHGRRASTLENTLGIKLFVIGKDGKSALAARAEDGTLTVYYALKKSVFQKADPDALPPGREMEAAAQEGAQSYVRSTVQGSQETTI